MHWDKYKSLQCIEININHCIEIKPNNYNEIKQAYCSEKFDVSLITENNFIYNFGEISGKWRYLCKSKTDGIKNEYELTQFAISIQLSEKLKFEQTTTAALKTFFTLIKRAKFSDREE